ncbi:hypothetical protein [Glycomyces sp. NPDC047010]|uniref:hypothetical protein n=1 Tax=Glycomyces sp. NPDC047010 TaxID=3155023 RepID=UPI0033D58CBB
MMPPSRATWSAPSLLPPPPQPRRNLWTVGGAVVAVVAIVLATVLVVLWRMGPAGGGGTGGDVLADETCAEFDADGYAVLFGTAPGSSEADGYTTGGSGVGTLTCTWFHDGADGSGLAVDAWTDADSAAQFWLDEKSWWTGHADTVTDFDGAGESGFLYVQGAGDEPQKRQITFVTGRLTVSVFCWIDPAQQSPDDADAYLEDLAVQAEQITASIA